MTREADAEADAPQEDALAGSIRAVRLGNGANCSSVGSVVDTLFLSAAVGGAVFAAICAALREEPVRVVGEGAGEDPRRDAGATDEERAP